jgi:hypothetical protein
MVCLGGAGLAQAQAVTPAQGLLTDRFVVSVGGFIVGTDLSGSLAGQSSANPEVDFDKSFGRDEDATRGRLDALWRITPAHHMRFMYFNKSSARTRVLADPIEWGDYTFQAGTSTTFNQKMEVMALGYEWAFMRTPTYEVAATLGVHYSETTLQLSGNALVSDANGNVTQVNGATKASSLPAPLPLIGLRGSWAVSPTWVLDAEVAFLQAKYEDYDGHWSDVRLGATWMFHRNFGAGLAYNNYQTRVDVTRPAFNGKLKTGYSGLQAFLTASF